MVNLGGASRRRPIPRCACCPPGGPFPIDAAAGPRHRRPAAPPPAKPSAAVVVSSVSAATAAAEACASLSSKHGFAVVVVVPDELRAVFEATGASVAAAGGASAVEAREGDVSAGLEGRLVGRFDLVVAVGDGDVARRAVEAAASEPEADFRFLDRLAAAYAGAPPRGAGRVVLLHDDEDRDILNQLLSLVDRHTRDTASRVAGAYHGARPVPRSVLVPLAVGTVGAIAAFATVYGMWMARSRAR